MPAAVPWWMRRFPPRRYPDVAVATGRVGAWLREHLPGVVPVAIGHRVAHGGPDYSAPVAVDDDILAALERLVPLAPMHQPYNLHPIRTIQERFPGVVQVACFDTAFHRGHPDVADRFAIPEALYDEGVRRYGFHGLSYEYIARALPSVAPEIAQGSVVVAHLGSGASMCAIKGGRSVDSTMAFTGLDGLPMGTRCGQIDPGVLLYLVSEKGYGAKELEHLLYHEAGLRGLSGISNDVRDLLASEDPRARLALDYFVYRVARELGRPGGRHAGYRCRGPHGRHQRELPRDARPYLRRCRVARSPTGRGFQPRGRPAHLDAGTRRFRRGSFRRTRSG